MIDPEKIKFSGLNFAPIPAIVYHSSEDASCDHTTACRDEEQLRDQLIIADCNGWSLVVMSSFINPK